MSLLKKLLEAIEVKVTPKRITRIGKFEDNRGKSRPLKVEFDNAESKSKVMSHANRLKDAPQDLKILSLSYDM